jgi:aminoglycoside phosphotransferase (APT) family kinase protein
MARMHADEVDTGADLVRRLLADQHPQWAGLPIEPVVPMGTDNALYRVGDGLVARLPRRPGSARRLERERRWLPRLAPHLPLEVPTPVAEGGPSDGYPFTWSVYTWLEGQSATPDRVRDAGRLADDLAALVSALQRVDASSGPPPGPENAWRGVPLSERDEQARASIADLAGEIDADAVTAAWETALNAPEWGRPPVWFHGDLDSRNLLARDGRLSGVLDWGCAGVGDPACDVMVAWKLFGGGGREAFRSALGVDDAAWARARGWVISQAVIALAYYTEETNAVLVAEARRWLAEALADHAAGVSSGGAIVRGVPATDNRSEPTLRGTTEYEEKAVGIVRSVLTPELLPPEWQNHPHPVGGYCYVASEALYYILGGGEAGLRAKRAPCAGGEHWWLEGPGDKLIDATADQFDGDFDYAEGVASAFLTPEPSPRAVKIILRAGAAGLTP